MAPLQGGNTAEDLTTEALVGSRCPQCGQRVDRANIRCPRCRRWFVPPPGRRSHRSLTLVATLTALVLAGFVAGVVLRWFWTPLPPGIVVPDEPAAAR